MLLKCIIDLRVWRFFAAEEASRVRIFVVQRTASGVRDSELGMVEIGFCRFDFGGSGIGAGAAESVVARWVVVVVVGWRVWRGVVVVCRRAVGRWVIGRRVVGWWSIRRRCVRWCVISARRSVISARRSVISARRSIVAARRSVVATRWCVVATRWCVVSSLWVLRSILRGVLRRILGWRVVRWGRSISTNCRRRWVISWISRVWSRWGITWFIVMSTAKTEST